MIRTSISMPNKLAKLANRRVASIQKRLPEYNLSDYIRDLLRKDAGLETMAGL